MVEETQMKQTKGQKAHEQINKMSERQIIDDLLKSVPTLDAVEVDLPSKNKFYNLIAAEKPITIRPMTFDDEKAMLSKKNVNQDILNILLGRCVENIDVGQLLQMDKLYLIMKLREISYGDEYNASISCPGCRRDNSVKFALSTLQVNRVDDTMTNPVEVKLPVIKKTAMVSLPRVSDENYFTNAEHAVSNLWRFVESVDGHDSKGLISKLIPELPLKDIHAILDIMSGNKYGIDTKVRFICNFCNHNEIMELPITSDFFSGN
jgi:hypothetical protein